MATFILMGHYQEMDDDHDFFWPATAKSLLYIYLCVDAPTSTHT